MVESDGRPDAPVTLAAAVDGGRVRFLQARPGGASVLVGADPVGPGERRTAVDVPVRTGAGLAALAPGLLAWVDPAAPAVLARAPAGDAGLGAIATTALPGPALRRVGVARPGRRGRARRRGRAPAPRGSRDGRRRHRLAGAPHAARRRWAAEPWRWPTGGGCWPPARAPLRSVGRGRRAGRRGGRGRPARGPARARAGARGARDGGAPEARAVRRLARGAGRAGRAAPALAGSAAAAPILSLQDDDLVNVRGPALDARLDALAATGTKVTRVDVLWREVAPHPAGRRAQPGRSRLRLEPLRRDRARPVGAGDLGHPRLLPHPGVGVAHRPAHRRAAGGRRSAVRRRDRPALLRARSPARPARSCREVRHIEVWNEPNLPGFWMPQCRQRAGRAALVSPGAYAALLAATYREIKAANPRSQVIGGVVGPAGRTPRTCVPGEGGAVGSLDFTRLVARRGAADRRLEPAPLPHRITAQGLLRAIVEHAAPGRQRGG